MYIIINRTIHNSTDTIGTNKISLLRSFLSLLNSDPISSSSFRYFKSRNCPCHSISPGTGPGISDNYLLSILHSHIFTIIQMDSSNSQIESGIIGYSHIDYDSNLHRYWLGICILSPYHNKGHGSKMIDFLFSKLKDINYRTPKGEIDELYLSVDNTNLNAIKLYKNKGFIQTQSTSNNTIIMKYTF
jgi:ribosomal protein S18 acetylase RimI-like enzyme